MRNKSLVIIFTVIVCTFSGCIEETYDMDRLSHKAQLSPVLASSAVYGEITLGDVLKANDTIIYDNDKLCRIIFRKDSVIDLRLKDYYNFDNMVDYDEVTTIGEVKISDFQTALGISLSQMSLLMSSALRAQLTSLDDGALHPFPPFPPIIIVDKSFTPLLNQFDYATFASGAIDITLRNELNTQISGVRIKLMNSSDHSAIGNELIISSIPPGATVTGSIDLAGQYVTKSIIATVVAGGSPGNPLPVIIDMDHSLRFNVQGRDLKVRSGRIILPLQTIDEGVKRDTITISPGDDVEIDRIRIAAGNLNYRLQSTSNAKASFKVTLSDALQGGVPVTRTITLNPRSVATGTVNLDNTTFDLTKDEKQRYNRVPVEYVITISSENNMIDFNSGDNVRAELNLPDPSLDYVNGYFGQKIETISSRTLDLDMDDVFNKISGDFNITDPLVRINYSNSFGIPVEVNLNALGINETETVALSRDAFTISYPDTTLPRDISSTVIVDKNNSRLSELVSMLPNEIRFSGTARMNPGGASSVRDNFAFDNSRLLAGIEIDIPMGLKISNLQFTETVDNFLDNEDSDNDEIITPGNFDFMRIDLTVTNGFPLGASVEMSLYDSEGKVTINSVQANDIIKPAPVDNSGKVTGPVSTSASIEFDEDFFNSIDKADKIVFRFKMKSTDNGTKEVKIYSDYNLTFKAAVVIRPDIEF
jgi:hypothetical protein